MGVSPIQKVPSITPGMVGKVTQPDADLGGVQEAEEESCFTMQTMLVAAFEGFTLVWMLFFLWNMCILGEPSIFIFLVFGYAFHLAIQCVLSSVDISGVQQALASLEETMDKDTTADILDELRATPPQITIKAEAYHHESKGTTSHRTEHVSIDHRETSSFNYGSWSDISGKLWGLDKYKIVSIAVLPEYICADEETDQSLRELEQSLTNVCRQYRRSVRTTHSVRLAHPRYPVEDRRVFVTMARGTTRPWWLSSRIYAISRFGCPFCGTMYRWLFHNGMATVRYRLVKQVSILVAVDAV